MGLNDLMTEIKQDPNAFLGEEAVENKVLKQVLSLVEDKISEVKNQAVKWSVNLLYCLTESVDERYLSKSGPTDQNHQRIAHRICHR
jgi:cullin-associated NEDD8-dissociated protein 1